MLSFKTLLITFRFPTSPGDCIIILSNTIPSPDISESILLIEYCSPVIPSLAIALEVSLSKLKNILSIFPE